MTTNTAVIRPITEGEPKRLAIVEAVKTSLRNWRQTSGRAPRKEYWSLALFTLVAPIAIFMIGLAAAVAVNVVSPDVASAVSGVAMLLAFVVYVVLLVPLLTAAVRRLHDGGHSGALYLIALVPYVGGFILLYFLVQGSQHGDNQFGPHPYRQA